MTITRTLAPLALLLAVAVAACGPTTASLAPSASGDTSSAEPSGASASPAASEPAASPAASGSAAPSEPAASEPAASADTGGSPAALIPATVGDVAMSVSDVAADDYIVANVGRRLTPILTALGKTPDDVAVATATGSAAGGATLFIDAVRISGADAEGLLAAFQTAASAAPGSVVEPLDVGGRSAVKVTTSSYTLAVTAEGDTLLYVQSPDAELVTQAVGAIG